MKKRIFGLALALVLCLGLLPGTAWAEEEPADGGDITTTGLSFYSPSNQTPKRKMVYRAGEGTVTWIPTLDSSGNITHGTFIFENTTFSMNNSYVLRYVTDPTKGVDGNVDVIIKGQNTITASKPYSYIFDINRNSVTSADQHPTLTIKGEDSGSLTYNNTTTGSGGYAVTSVRNTVSFENIKMDLRNGALEIYGLIKIKNSEINITLDGAGVPSYQFALQTHSGGGTYPNSNIGLTVEGSKIKIDSKGKGISAPPLCDFTDSEIEVRVPSTSDAAAISTNYDKIHVVRSTVKAIGGSRAVVLPGYDFSVDSNSDFWNELDQSIYVAGVVNIIPETNDKQLVVHQNFRLTIENDAAFNTMLYDGAVFTAANVKNLSISNSGNAKILLTDKIPSITVSGDIANNGWFTLEYEGNEPKSPVILTAKSAEDAARITFDTNKFERKDNQIVWKQTPLAAPAGLSWDGAKAQWGAVENAQGYTVQLYKDGEAFGEPVAVDSATEYDFTDFLTETGGYTFTVKAMGGGSILHADSESSGASEEFDYTAPERFTVSFDAQGGTAVAGQTVVDGKTVSKPADPTRSGYIFGGWYKEAGCETPWSFETDTVTADLTLYAKWTPQPVDPPPAAKTHTVRFLDGGTELASLTVREGSKAAPPDEPVKAGYRFTGWYTDPAGTEAFDFETPVTGDLVLYAKWTALPGGEDVPSGGGSSGRDDDDDGDEPRPPAATATAITQNPDGSTTKTTTDRRTGTVTTVTTAPDGTSVTVVTDQNGHVVSTEASVPKGAAVLPAAPEGEVKITVKGGGRAEVTLPAESAGPGTVAVLISPEGTKTVARKSILTENGVVLMVQGSAVARLEDRGRTFPDVPEGWKAEAAAFVSAREILNGGTDGLFRPDAPMTRAMLAVALHNLEGNPFHGTAAFLDVPEHVWYAEAVSWASARGIVTGYTDEIFGPDDCVTREQLAVMLWRAAGRPAPSSRVLPFPDADQAADYAREALCWAVEHGIVHGGSGGTLDPKGLATRAQAAQMLKNFLENG